MQTVRYSEVDGRMVKDFVWVGPIGTEEQTLLKRFGFNFEHYQSSKIHHCSTNKLRGCILHSARRLPNPKKLILVDESQNPSATRKALVEFMDFENESSLCAVCGAHPTEISNAWFVTRARENGVRTK